MKGGLVRSLYTKKSAGRRVSAAPNGSSLLLSIVLSSKVCLVSEGLISLSLCTHIPSLTEDGN